MVKPQVVPGWRRGGDAPLGVEIGSGGLYPLGGDCRGSGIRRNRIGSLPI